VIDRITSNRYGEKGYGKNARDCLVVGMTRESCWSDNE
jgi:hypothetical protein